MVGFWDSEVGERVGRAGDYQCQQSGVDGCTMGRLCTMKCALGQAQGNMEMVMEMMNWNS